MNRRPERLADLLPGVVADLAQRHTQPNRRTNMTDQYTEHTIKMMRSLARGEHPYGTGPFDADHIKLFATDAHRLLGRLDDVVEAANVLFANRHSLPPDVLRTLACVWQCASAARYGEPHEEFWADQDDFYAGHDVDECEAENQAGAA